MCMLKKEIKLVILVGRDEALLNYLSRIAVNPKEFPRMNRAGTMIYMKWLTNPERRQKNIAEFGKDKYGAPLFSPTRGTGRPAVNKEK